MTAMQDQTLWWHLIQKIVRIFRTMRMLSENEKNTCFFSDFAVKYKVRHTMQKTEESICMAALMQK